MGVATLEPASARSTAASTGPQPPKLRKNLKLWQVLGVSLGLMGPSLSANIDGQGAAPLVGRAIPLTFVIATVGVLLVSWGFARLCQHFNHSGSVFGLVGATLGPRAGVAAGWSLLGTYTLFGMTCSIAGGIFTSALVRQLGIWGNPPQWFAYAAALAFLAMAFALAVTPIRKSTEILLAFEGITVLLVLIVSAIVIARLATHSAPTHLPFTWSVFKPSKGTSTSTLFLGVVFGFLAFAGFEGAATMGEEAVRPRRDIPRAILGTVLFAGFFYVLTMAVMVMGFGTSSAGLAAFHNSGSPLGFLGTSYVASWIGDLVTVGTVVSAFGGALGCIVAASRLLFAMSRASTPRQSPLTTVSSRWGTPIGATTALIAVMAVVTIAFGWGSSTPAINEFAYLGTIGTLLVLCAYMMTVIGAGRLLFLGVMKVRRYEYLAPFAAVAVVGYTFYRNVVPYPTGAAAWLPIVSAAWLVLGVGAVVVSPRLARRIGTRLTTDEGLKVAEADEVPAVSPSHATRRQTWSADTAPEWIQ
jgi:amino acid transporter